MIRRVKSIHFTPAFPSLYSSLAFYSCTLHDMFINGPFWSFASQVWVFSLNALSTFKHNALNITAHFAGLNLQPYFPDSALLDLALLSCKIELPVIYTNLITEGNALSLTSEFRVWSSHNEECCKVNLTVSGYQGLCHGGKWRKGK